VRRAACEAMPMGDGGDSCVFRFRGKPYAAAIPRFKKHRRGFAGIIFDVMAWRMTCRAKRDV